MSLRLRRLLSWEGLLLFIFILTVLMNSTLAPAYLGLDNWINIFMLSIEKIIVALAMAFVIINAEIDLSVASVMGLAAGVLAWLFTQGVPFPVAIVAALLTGVVCGLFNGFWIAYVGLPSLVVTLATLMFGWQFATLVVGLVLLATTIHGDVAWSSFGCNGLLLVCLPVFVSWLVLRMSERYLPGHFFIYIFVAAFFGAGRSGPD